MEKQLENQADFNTALKCAKQFNLSYNLIHAD